MLYKHTDGKLYGFIESSEDTFTLVELDGSGSMIRMVLNNRELNEIITAMGELSDEEL